MKNIYRSAQNKQSDSTDNTWTVQQVGYQRKDNMNSPSEQSKKMLE